MAFGPRFLVDRNTITCYLEPTSLRRNQVDVRCREALANLGRQTGGARLVVSDDAVFDADLHGSLVVVCLIMASTVADRLIPWRRVLLKKLVRLRRVHSF
jgi:hypothetical protein